MTHSQSIISEEAVSDGPSLLNMMHMAQHDEYRHKICIEVLATTMDAVSVGPLW